MTAGQRCDVLTVYWFHFRTVPVLDYTFMSKRYLKAELKYLKINKERSWLYFRRYGLKVAGFFNSNGSTGTLFLYKSKLPTTVFTYAEISN
jgi:hypothetical protein